MLRNDFPDEPLRRILEGMVHPSVAADGELMRRHRDFIAAHLAAGLLALVAVTAFLVIAGRPAPAVALAFLWLAAPLPVAAFLSRTGRFGVAHLLSVGALAAFLAYCAALTGGLSSPVLVWLLVVPAEAALAGSGRVTASASVSALAALAVVALLDVSGWSHAATPAPGMTFAIIAGAVVYGGALAVRIGRLHERAERRTREGEGRYRLLADNATDLITRHSLTGAVEFASPAARAVAGCAPIDLMGDGMLRRVHVADRPAFLQSLSEADRTGRPVTVEFRLLRGDQASPPAHVWLEMRCRPAIDPVDAGRTLVAVTRDVTARKDYEAAFEESRLEAERANRAKGQFLANMSHELRTPLNAIIGFSDMLRQDMPGPVDPERRREYARLIHASGEHLLEVVNSILDMSKIEAGRLELSPERFELAPVVEASIDMLSQQAAQRGLTIVRAIQADLPDIVADRRACRQILLNLISNAVKFTAEGGRVTVAARLERTSFVIEVSDNGIGISAADLKRIGTPFMQADASYGRRYEGTGLGLSVVKGLVALHGGTLAVASVLGSGTTVTVRLPSAAAPGWIEQRERKIA